MKGDELQVHMFATYTTLRVGVAIISFAFPLLLWGGGKLLGIQLPDSMSAYYHLTVDGQSMRNWFVGILFAIGIILYLYKGYSPQENYALNAAGIFAIGIAIFPMEWGCGQECEKISMHGISAVMFFLSFAYVCIRCASDTLYLMKDEVREKRYRRIYWMIAAGLILSPLIALLLTVILGGFKSYTFYAEAVGIWFFASYWLIKTRDISFTNSERDALSNKIEA